MFNYLLFSFEDDYKLIGRKEEFEKCLKTR